MSNNPSHSFCSRSGAARGLVMVMVLALLAFVTSSAWAQEEPSKQGSQESGTPADRSEQDSDDSDKPKLTIGDKAPALDIEHWISDDNGLFIHTTEFEEGSIYVVDFWAVQWVPTTRMLPRIAEIQDKFKDDDVQIISIGLHPLEFVEQFMEQPLPKQKPGETKTFGEVTETFSFTCDPDRSVFKDYFDASGRTQVPSSFVVGKTGLIEWIGHPKDLEEPLQLLIDDKWDREKFAASYAVEMKKQFAIAEQQKVFAKAMEEFPKALREGPEETLKYLKEAADNPDYKSAKAQIMKLRIQLLIRMKNENAAKELRQYADEFTNDEDSAGELNDLVWQVYERHEALGDIDSEVLEASLYAARIAVKFSPKSGAINDTVAHFVYVVEGDLDEAIEWQKKAVANAEGREADLQPFLDQLLEEKRTGKKPGKAGGKSDKSKKKEKSDF